MDLVAPAMVAVLVDLISVMMDTRTAKMDINNLRLFIHDMAQANIEG
jgi:hypothetical protein